MIGIIILSFLASSHAAPQGMPSFSISGYSRSNVPEMTVTFENGKDEEIVLEPYSTSPCNYIGELKSEPGSSVGVTGCLNGPDDKMYITLLSDKNTLSFAYIMDYDGKVTADENPLKNQKEPSGLFPTDLSLDRLDDSNDDFKDHKDEMGDEEKDNFDEKMAKASAMNVPSWPSKIYAYVKLGYDNSLAAQMTKQGTTFAAWADSVMTHVQTHYRHKSLPTKIEFKYDHSETARRYENLPSTDFLNNWSVWALNDVKSNPKVDLYVIFGKDADPLPGQWVTVGKAWVGGACSGGNVCNDQSCSSTSKVWLGTSFNEWSSTPSATAATAAHEMGHNFGMSHDFDNKHGGQGGPCDGHGIMSYNSDKPMKWSSCSVNDFTGYYNSKKWGTTCLKDWKQYVAPCANKCPNCGMQPPTFCDNPEWYGGCNGQYKSYFTEYCAKTCNAC